MRDQDFRRHDRHDAQQDDGHGHDGHGHGDHDRHHEDEGRGSRRGGRRGPIRGGFPGGPPDFRGAGPWEGGPRRRGSRARRGDARAAALALLAEQPLNGYQIIQQIGERSGGVWRPSPGSVYPALQQLQDEGLIQSEPGETGHRGYVLTDSGREYAAAHPDELRAPWDVVSGGAGGAAIELRTQLGQLAMAAFQVAGAGTDAQQAQARKILADSRKSLYRILADGEDEATTQEK
jgi:DNA-binding PadR family transcriptional regulator